MAMFTQFWYWFPLVHFIGLSIKPAALVGLNKDLKMPKFDIVSAASPGLYEYVPGGPPEKVKEVTKAPSAILSVTAKTKAREQRRAAAKKMQENPDATAMEVDSDSPADVTMEVKTPSDSKADPSKDPDQGGDKEEKEKPKEKATHACLKNPCRVLAGQEKYIQYTFKEGETDLDARYAPVKIGPSACAGVVMMKDLRPGDAEEFVEMASLLSNSPAAVDGSSAGATEDASAAPVGVGADETEDDGYSPTPPEPFEYTDEN
eukprot:Plantae.Rhodophyta-Palmaria_palmata.ctg4441.p1 GENE.Plantae.Rhodophyta-Palmaria_palmata.ctg4441~~Plantae.Rhodophyta-Palmaria_palmata.ctg4441.p1  ORF type:complete len:268 (+),score=55.30 Plantae.Rhodophyta-Palmaria_palmata.ctg4441:22-804(+)